MTVATASGASGTAATTARRWSRLDVAERRRQILAAARQLFAQRHYDAVSTADIAAAAGVTRGLVHHYFGGKRALYLEVVRSLLALPEGMFAAEIATGDRDSALRAAVDLWLDVAERGGSVLLAAYGAQGFGRDPEVEAIFDDARERTADQVIEILRPGQSPGVASAELRAAVRAYAGFVEAATFDWLRGGPLSRAQLRELLAGGLLSLDRDVVPKLEEAGRR
jgi:AcrR family transcriptional regulator